MKNINRILVPVDFSVCARAALDAALYMAERHDAAVELLHVYEPPFDLGNVPIQVPGSPPQPIGDYIRFQVRQNLDNLLEDVKDGKVVVKGRLVTGRVEQEVARIANEEDFDLIVMGTHGRRGVARFFLGSVAERILREAPCPVLTVRANEDEVAQEEADG